MKTNLKSIGTLLAIGLLAFSARAGVLLHETFPTDGNLTNAVEDNVWTTYSGNFSGVIVNGSQMYNGQTFSDDVYALLSGQPYAVTNNNPTNILYSSYSATFQNLPTASGGYYFSFFKDNGLGTTFKARVFALTNGAALGKFRLGLANAASSASVTNTTDLSLGVTYTVVTRYVNLTNGAFSTLWINPVNETSSSLTAGDSTGGFTLCTYAFRQPGSTTPSLGAATVAIDNLYVGSTFADVVPGSVNPPTIIVQPQDVTVFNGSSASFTNLAAGDATLGYQWYSVTNNVTNAIPGATGLTVTLSSLTTNQTGFIFAVVTNAVGTNQTRLAQLTVSPQPIPPIIDSNITPTGSTNLVGDTVTFSVTAHALPAPAYQWKFVPATNSAVTNLVTGATSSTLTLNGVTTNQSGKYFVTITNSIGYLTTNSALATLKVNPPPFLTIGALRALEDPVTWSATNTTSLYTIQGIVTTWTNLTTSGNCEFYIQDSSGGIAVFWSGADSSTNMPPAGALVQVTGPFANFSGLLEVEPVFTNSLHSVAVLSTGNPLPKAQPLPFDPNIQNNPATMEKLEGSYFVASNVMLNLSTPTFVSSANDPTTNLAYHILADTNALYNITFTNDVGQTFILFVNSHTDIPFQTKPTGPVTIYGVLGQFVSTSPYIGGYEFTPSRFADIISYFHATNVVTNVKRYGDLLTNTYAESVLRPGETLTTYVSASDPVGGTVTLTPITGGLPGSASWSGVTSGTTATAVFHFTPVTGDEGVNYLIALAESSTSGFTGTNYWNIYVPTADEQKMAITEFLANPTSNTNLPDFNPLHRPTDTLGISTNDEYIEIVNLSAGTTLDYGWDIDQGNPNVKYFDSNAGSGTQVPPLSALVVFGGNTTETPSLPVPTATTGPLVLANAGTTLVLRNPSGYIIDRVVYTASDLVTNSSLSRFPTIDSPFAPQIYVGTNGATAGLQYDEASWTAPVQIPKGINNVAISAVNNQSVLQFTAVPNQASTLWSAASLDEPLAFRVIYGQTFTTTSGLFTITNVSPVQFYYLTTQTNRP